ncbi:MAG: acylphosphatase [Candidatus Syntrophosphaera sp.]|jgi:acylphosphatase
MLSWEITAHGRVQGVGFRSFARMCARKLFITGYAKNRYDGTVLIIARGDGENLKIFCDMLRGGNGFSRVSRLEIEEITGAERYDDFEIR